MNRWPCYSSALLLFFLHCQGARYRVIPADEKITKKPRGQLPKHTRQPGPGAVRVRMSDIGGHRDHPNPGITLATATAHSMILIGD